MKTFLKYRYQLLVSYNFLQVAPTASETLNVVKEKVVEAAKISQEAAAEAAKVTKEYVAAGAQKTQEVYNEYVSDE